MLSTLRHRDEKSHFLLRDTRLVKGDESNTFAFHYLKNRFTYFFLPKSPKDDLC